MKQLTLLHALEGEELKRLEDVYVDAIKAPLIIEIELRTLQIDMAKLNRKRNVFQSATQEDLKTLEEHTAHAAALEAQMKKEAEVSERRRQERLDAELKLKNTTYQLENTKKQVEESSKKLKSEKKELRRLKKELKKLNAHVDQINQQLHLQSAMSGMGGMAAGMGMSPMGMSMAGMPSGYPSPNPSPAGCHGYGVSGASGGYAAAAAAAATAPYYSNVGMEHHHYGGHSMASHSMASYGQVNLHSPHLHIFLEKCLFGE